MPEPISTACEASVVGSAGAAPRGAPRLATILHVQWGLAIACAYLVLFGSESGDVHGVGPLVVVGFLATNLILGRVDPELAVKPLFGAGLAALDTLLITTSLYVAGQLSVEFVLLCLGVLVMAIAGLRIGTIALATLGLSAAYLAIVWVTGDQTLWRSSVLLRVPLLFTAAMVYAWLVEMGSGQAAGASQTAPHASILSAEIGVQWEAIERAGAALRDGSIAGADAALREVAAQNRAMRLQLRR